VTRRLIAGSLITGAFAALIVGMDVLSGALFIFAAAGLYDVWKKERSAE
jgi:hypothetical protein